MTENTVSFPRKLMITHDISGVAEIKMNGIRKEVPFASTIVNKTFSATSTIDVST
jgi:hypothetical protein